MSSDARRATSQPSLRLRLPETRPASSFPLSFLTLGRGLPPCVMDSTVVPEATFVSVDAKEMEPIAKSEQVTVIPSYKLFKGSKLLFDV